MVDNSLLSSICSTRPLAFPGFAYSDFLILGLTKELFWDVVSIFSRAFKQIQVFFV